MKINNPRVTLADEARNGVQEEVRSGFLDWLYEFNVEGDDGESYMVGVSILSMALEKMDLVTMCLAKGKGGVKQLPTLKARDSVRDMLPLTVRRQNSAAGKTGVTSRSTKFIRLCTICGSV